MVNTMKEKGDRLEDAVENIEKLILRSNKALKEGTFRIERNKIMTINGVKYEIDIYVEIDIQIGQKFVYIFECKNWDSVVVPPKEISYFSEKIKATNAHKGYFIAKKFSKYALAKAKEDTRIDVLQATDEFTDITMLPDIHFIGIKHLKKEALFTERIHKLKKVDFSTSKATYQSKTVNLREFLNPFLNSVVDERMKHEPTNKFNEGTYNYSHKKKFSFAPRELLINNSDVKLMEVNVTFEVKVNKPKIVSRFDIEKKGRVITYEGEAIPGSKIQISLIESR